MFLAKLKNFIKRIINFVRRRFSLASRVTLLEQEVYSLKIQMDTMSAFYERRLDAVIYKITEEKRK